jgi:hypothetical protein
MSFPSDPASHRFLRPPDWPLQWPVLRFAGKPREDEYRIMLALLCALHTMSRIVCGAWHEEQVAVFTGMRPDAGPATVVGAADVWL